VPLSMLSQDGLGEVPSPEPHKYLAYMSRWLSIPASSLPQGFDEAWKARIWDRWSMENHPKLKPWLAQQRLLTIRALSCMHEDLCVFEPACGTGRVTWDLLSIPNVKTVVAWDINRTAVATTRERLSTHPRFRDLRLSENNIRALPEIVHRYWTPGSVLPVVVCLEVFFHLPGLEELINDMATRLPSGTVVVGNLKSREGLFMNRALNRGLGAALELCVLMAASLLLRRSYRLPEIGAHTAVQASRLLSPFVDPQIVSNDLYHWFTATVRH